MGDWGGAMGCVWVVLVIVGLVGVVDVAAVPSVVGVGRLRSNATAVVDGSNDGTMRLLMESSSRAFTADECMESVKKMRRNLDDYFTSFPPPDFEPPGARQWCQCLESDPSNIASLPSMPNFLRPDAPKAEFEAAFDRCRASVLDGSEINTEDICRGMFDLFGTSLGYAYVTFCGRICRTLDNPSYYVGGSAGPGLNMYNGCGRECAAETMPGYCAKYKLWYTQWRFLLSYRYTQLIRQAGVGSVAIISQSGADLGKRGRREKAQELCDALRPLIGGDANECCNYPRGFAALQQCCALDDRGAVFDCAKNVGGSRNLYYECVTNARLPDSYYFTRAQLGCRYLLIRDYSESMRNMKVFKERGTGHFLFRFNEADLTNFCSDYGGGTCCDFLKGLNIAENCADPSTLRYVGRTTAPLDGPTPPAGGDDPCLGTCQAGRECVVAPNGSPFCVDCTALLKPKRSGGGLAECCRYDAAAKRCVTALRNSPPGICERSDDGILVRADDGSTTAADFRSDAGYTCSNPREFRDNNAACKVVVTRAGTPKCFD